MTSTLVIQQQQLDDCLDALWDVPTAALDTEFVRVSTFYPKPGLIQVGVGAKTWLIDPLAKLEWGRLARWLAEQPECIFHAAAEDYEVLYRLTGALPGRVFDTQIAASLLTPKPSLSLQALVEQQLGVTLDKGETRSDWTQRPLSPSQLHYAAEDVRVLEPLAETLKVQLNQLDRAQWMAEDMADVLSRVKAHIDGGDVDTQVARFGNAWRLSERSMARLYALVSWREDAARRYDRPRKHILSDQSIFHLATSKSVSRRHQFVVDAGLSERQADRYGSVIQALLADSDDAPVRATPPPPLSKRQKTQLESLQHAISTIANDYHIAPEVLVKKRDLIAVLDGRGWQPTGWRSTLIGEVIHAFS